MKQTYGKRTDYVSAVRKTWMIRNFEMYPFLINTISRTLRWIQLVTQQYEKRKLYRQLLVWTPGRYTEVWLMRNVI
jgi:hypothetical protein